MRGRAASCIRNAVLAGAIAGLGACQTAGQGPVVTASVAQAQPASAMEGDIVRILKQGGLSSSAPGSLQTRKMPADVQQAVAALQGGEAVPVPFGGAAAGVTPVGVQSMPSPQAGASSIALLPTASGPIPSNALALAPVQPAAPNANPQQPALLAALAQTQAAHVRRAAAPRLARVPAVPAAPAFPTARPAAVLALAPVPVAPAAPAPPPEPPPPRRF